MRRAGRAVLWAVAAGLVMFTGLRLTGLDIGWPVVAALAFTPYLAVASLVSLAAAAVARAWRPLVALAACTLVLAALVVPRTLPASAPPAGGPPLRVMTVNLYGGAGDLATVADLVRRHRVDVLTVLELTGSDAGLLAAAGIDTLLPHQRLRPGDSVEGSGIYARFPLSPAADLERDSRFEMPATPPEPGWSAPGAPVARSPGCSRRCRSTGCWSTRGWPWTGCPCIPSPAATTAA